jgi:peptide/nickel transport system substrate-binding protein
VCLVGCGRDAGAPAGLVIALESDPQSLDPRFGVDATSARVGDLLHVALTAADPAAGRVPELARSWEWADDRTLVFHLREDVRFSDGRPVGAEDVRATYEAVKDPTLGSPRRATLASLDRVEASDAHTVTMRLREPDAAFPDATGLPILPADLARRPDEATVGAGPYRLVEARRGDRIVVEPNPYASRRATIAPVVLRIVPDAVVRVLELERGGVGFLQETLEPEILGRLRALPSLRATITPGTSVAYLAFNFRDPRLRDRRVRRAIASAIELDLLVRSFLGDTARVATGLLTPEHWAYAPVPRVRRSLRRARRLLDRAGLRDPDGPDGPRPRFRLVYKTSNQPARRRLGEAIQADLARIGIALDVRTYEWGTLFADVRSGNFELAAMTWVGIADPDLYRLAYHSTMLPPAGMNRGAYASRTMDRLTDAGRRTPDPAARRAIYARVQRWAARDLPVLPLWWEDRVVVATGRLDGFVPRPSGDLAGLADAVLR